MPGALDDAAADADALGLERPQGRLDLRVPVERRGEGDRVVRRLGDAGADMRARDERGVADERDAAERHRRRLEVVDRLQEGLLGQTNRSKIVASQPWRRSSRPANSPLIEPPMTSARLSLLGTHGSAAVLPGRRRAASPEPINTKGAERARALQHERRLTRQVPGQ